MTTPFSQTDQTCKEENPQRARDLMQLFEKLILLARADRQAVASQDDTPPLSAVGLLAEAGAPVESRSQATRVRCNR